MTAIIFCGILIPVLLLAALCVWLAVRLQRAERELWEYRHFDWYKAVRRNDEER